MKEKIKAFIDAPITLRRVLKVVLAGATILAAHSHGYNKGVEACVTYFVQGDGCKELMKPSTDGEPGTLDHSSLRRF